MFWTLNDQSISDMFWTLNDQSISDMFWTLNDHLQERRILNSQKEISTGLTFIYIHKVTICLNLYNYNIAVCVQFLIMKLSSINL
jgi:hypothetical protein